MSTSSNNRKPALLALVASFLLTVLIIVGSRNLEHYDSALFGYTVASVVAFGAIVFRYAIWLQRPATRVYWRRGWKLYLQREKFLRNTADAAKTLATNIAGQSFIFKRGFSRWAMHFLIMWGCVISALITFPLVFGWVHFKLEGELGYRAYVFGFPLNVMQGRSVIAWITFHALDFTAVMVIVGCAIAIHRRLRDRGAIALQQFTLDFVPHLLLIAISVSGLMLTASSLWLQGYMYHFIALTHQIGLFSCQRRSRVNANRVLAVSILQFFELGSHEVERFIPRRAFEAPVSFDQRIQQAIRMVNLQVSRDALGTEASFVDRKIVTRLHADNMIPLD